MKTRLEILFPLFFLTLTVSCSWDNEEAFYPPEAICDTLDVSFSSQVLPILTNNCFSCHSNQNAPDFAFGISLEDHADVALMGPAITGAIKHLDNYSPMPKNAPMLDSCSIMKIEAWVNQGSPDN